jgi:hypothetical protein
MKEKKMNALKKTLFIIAVVFASVQSVRHVYARWIDTSDSVLDRYESEVSGKIKNAGSLEELQSMYDDAHKKVEAYEANRTNPKVEGYERETIEPYKTERMLKHAIENWEAGSNEISKIRFYFIAGLVFLMAGYILYRKVNLWLGLTFVIVGFMEMLYWTSPNLLLGASIIEFNILLDNKLILSAITLALLIAVAYLTGTLKENKIKRA